MLSSNVINGEFRSLSAPITVHLELTQACNERCRHCYNFWREDAIKGEAISQENLDFTLKELRENNVFHVILTGGEPFLVFDKLLHALEKCFEAGMSVSVNSNLMLATPEKIKALKDVGLEHILTSVNSFDPDTNDYIANTPGALEKIMRGIKITQEGGIRVTPNMIVSDINKGHIYNTGKYLKENGVEKFLANRTIPNKDANLNERTEFVFDEKAAKTMFDELLQLKNNFGMQVGTCRTVPNCFFEDLEKYSIFLGRGCSAGKKHMCLNIDGVSHACVHEEKSYGNIHEIGVKGVWEKMSAWRSLDYIPEKCRECHLFHLCDGGCRLVGEAYDGNISGKDNLCVGAENIPPYNDGITEETLDRVKNGTFTPISPLKYRKEEGFYMFRIVGARIAFVEDIIAKKLIFFSEKNKSFTLNDIGVDHIKQIAACFKEGLINVG